MSSSEATTYITAFSNEQVENAEKYFQGYTPVWLDTAMDNPNSAFNVCLGTLRSIQQVHKFNDGKECYDFLCSITEKRAFLILSCKIGDQLLNDFIALPQLEYIYQFGNETILKKEQSKLVEVSSVKALYDHLSRHSTYTTEEDNDTDFASLASTETVRSIEDLDDDARIYIFYQLLIEILLRLPKTPQIREQFYSFCMEKTNDNPAQQKIFLNQMENYQPEQAISWYTGACFLHKLLNRTCRLGKIQDMFKLAFFMIDLNARLKFVHDQYFDCYKEKTHVFRGRPMSTIEYEKLKNSIGNLVVTKSFLSTTWKKDVAAFYAGVGAKKTDFVPAILHLIINKQRNETKPFAYTIYESLIKSDDEVLISIGTVFRITDRNEENGIQEFTLFRGDEEKDVECRIENNFREQAKENKEEFFHSSSPSDADEYSKIADILTSPIDNQIKEPIENTTPSSAIKISAETKPVISDEDDYEFLGTDARTKRILMQVEKLREIKDIFILDYGPVYEKSSGSSAISPKSDNIIIEGRILPTKEPYSLRSFRVRFTIGTTYPIEPPKFHFLDIIYHPYINPVGDMCIALLNQYTSYDPSISLADIIQDAEKKLTTDDFDDQLIFNNEAYRLYNDNQDEFNRVVGDYVLQYGHSRT